MIKPTAVHSVHVYEVRPRKDRGGVDLISDVLPFGRLWYGQPNAASNAIGYAQHFSRSHDAVIPVYDESGVRSRFLSKTERRLPSIPCAILNHSL